MVAVTKIETVKRVSRMEILCLSLPPLPDFLPKTFLVLPHVALEAQQKNHGPRSTQHSPVLCNHRTKAPSILKSVPLTPVLPLQAWTWALWTLKVWAQWAGIQVWTQTSRHHHLERRKWEGQGWACRSPWWHWWHAYCLRVAGHFIHVSVNCIKCQRWVLWLWFAYAWIVWDLSSNHTVLSGVI